MGAGFLNESNAFREDYVEKGGIIKWVYFNLEDMPELNYAICQADELKYNSSWDWLMPVIEKIEEMGVKITISLFSVEIKSRFGIGPEYDNGFAGGGSKIELLHHALVEFIKWYNQQKQA